MSEHTTTLRDRTRPAAAGTAAPDSARTVYVAVVHAAGTICHICAATTEEELAVRLGEYVREHARYQLWPADAERVLCLVRADRTQDAVDLYFTATGARWAREELVVREIGGPGPEA